MSLFSNHRRLEVHGHRGCRGLRPENTLPAFLHALALGADVLELDVVISADQQVVVSHEPWMAAHLCRRPTGQPIAPSEEQQHNIYRLSYAQIRQYDCGQTHPPAYPEQVLMPACKPLLAEVLAATEAASQQLSRSPPGYSIEIKSEPAGDGIFHPTPINFVSLVLAVIKQAGIAERSTLLSFDARVLQEVRLQAPHLATCLLLEEQQAWLAQVEGLGFVPQVLGPDFRSVTAQRVQQVRQSYPALRLVPWTVNEPATMRQLQAWGVDGITTDYPDRLLALLRETMPL